MSTYYPTDLPPISFKKVGMVQNNLGFKGFNEKKN
jgi:hypothetical protein